MSDGFGPKKSGGSSGPNGSITLTSSGEKALRSLPTDGLDAQVEYANARRCLMHEHDLLTDAIDSDSFDALHSNPLFLCDGISGESMNSDDVDVDVIDDYDGHPRHHPTALDMRMVKVNTSNLEQGEHHFATATLRVDARTTIRELMVALLRKLKADDVHVVEDLILVEPSSGITYSARMEDVSINAFSQNAKQEMLMVCTKSYWSDVFIASARRCPANSPATPSTSHVGPRVPHPPGDVGGGVVEPITIDLGREEENDGARSLNSPRDTKAVPVASAICIKGYSAKFEDELSIKVGDVIAIVEKPAYSACFWRGYNGSHGKARVGFFPSSNVKEIKLENVTGSFLEAHAEEREKVYARSRAGELKEPSPCYSVNDGGKNGARYFTCT